MKQDYVFVPTDKNGNAQSGIPSVDIIANIFKFEQSAQLRLVPYNVYIYAVLVDARVKMPIELADAAQIKINNAQRKPQIFSDDWPPQNYTSMPCVKKGD